MVVTRGAAFDAFYASGHVDAFASVLQVRAVSNIHCYIVEDRFYFTAHHQ